MSSESPAPEGSHTPTKEERADYDRLRERLLESMSRRRPPQSPSTRTPETSWRSNDADRIERQLQRDGHRTWGFVIYRTTYENDDDWAEFVRRLRYQLKESMESYNGSDILELHALTLFNDRSLFDGASTATIRAHFRQWTENAFHTEQDDGNSENISPAWSPRYRYCVQVDAAALHSSVHDALDPSLLDLNLKKGWVKLIDKNWMLRSDNPIYTGQARDPEIYEQIDGITEADVGWMKCPYDRVLTEYYVAAININFWPFHYERPPIVVGWPYDE